jgi:hypothetical protein
MTTVKTRNTTITIALLLGSGWAVFSQMPGRAQLPDHPDASIEHAAEMPMPFDIAVDRETWTVFSPSMPNADLSHYNTPEHQWRRYEAVLAMEHYDEYLRDYPLSEEEAADIARVREYMERPPTLEEAVEQLSPEERKEFAASLQAFLDFGLDGSE